jgi:coenzyme F420 hydrogenase subunit beta
MSFELLKTEVIDAGLCQGCGLCVGSCKHIEMENSVPILGDYCILERNGQDCGKCYQSCPQATQEKFEEKQPLAVYSLKSNNPEILAKASSGGFVTTLTKELLENESLSEIVMVQKTDEQLLADGVSDPVEVVTKAGIVYGRSGVLEKLVKLTGDTFEPIGIVGLPCEMRGAAQIGKVMNREILKIGLFCSSQIFPTRRCGCTLIGDTHPVVINELKNFVTEWELKQEYKSHNKPFDEIEKMNNEEMNLQEGKTCDSCNQFCSHCQDFAAVYSDITAGEVGSEKGYTTVVAWTERGKELVEKAIKKGLFDIGKANEENLKTAIKLKSTRELISFEQTPRQKVLNYVTIEGQTTISKISEALNLDTKKVRYEALRLVQLNQIEMKVEPGLDEPLFSPVCED